MESPPETCRAVYRNTINRQLYVLLMMGGIATRNMQSSLQKYNKMYIVASCWTYIHDARTHEHKQIVSVCLSVSLHVVYPHCRSSQFVTHIPGKYCIFCNQSPAGTDSGWLLTLSSCCLPFPLHPLHLLSSDSKIAQ